MTQLALAVAQPRRIDLVVYGQPAPQGSKSFKGMSRSGHAIMVESSKRVKPWRELVWSAAVEAKAEGGPLDGPLVGRIVFTVPKPKSAPKNRTTYPDRMPDLSKLLRSTEDALVQAGAIADDARIIGLERLWKAYPNEDPEALDAPGVRITIWEVRR